MIARVALILVLVAFLVGVWIGRGWGQSDQGDEVTRLTGELTALSRDLATARSTATGNADAAKALRDSLKTERDQRLAQQRAAAAELDARAGRIAQLERKAAQRRAALKAKVETDEDCTALRRMPVCAALADGLWGQPATAGPH
ncbi:hypothetical protein LRX76_11795 [Stenotrophomonas sp. MMGLT7]|nr:hypothetical protein [Stenotrophomonas sp. MMGLT7]